MRGLLAERAFSEISVGDIAERATVNRATFYAHFEDKGHLAATMLSDDLHDALLARIVPPVPFGPASLALAATATFEFVDSILKGCPKHAAELAGTVGTTLQATLQSFLRTWLALDPTAMRAFPGADPETAASVLAWSLYGGALRWSRLARRPPVADAGAEVVRLLLRDP